MDTSKPLKYFKQLNTGWLYSGYFILIIFSILVLYPLIWMIFSSLKSLPELLQNRWLWPKTFVFTNYIQAWTKANFSIYFSNSLIITCGAVLLMLLVGALAAFAITRYKFSGGNNILYYFICGQIIPLQVTMIPLLIILKSMNLVNSRMGLIFVYTAAGLPFVIFLLQGFFRTIPKEMDEAARIDGCSEIGIFWRVILPLSGPALSTVIIFQSLWVWNEFLCAVVFLRREQVRTLTVGIYSMVGEWAVNFPIIFAALTISMVPILILYYVLSAQFVKGITAGALKG
jgi:raffinose/stachyose/melibiose transport system permease protein